MYSSQSNFLSVCSFLCILLEILTTVYKTDKVTLLVALLIYITDFNCDLISNEYKTQEVIRPQFSLVTIVLIFMSVFFINRNIGYGLQNTMARVGAIIGPQLVTLVTYLLSL